MARELFEDKSSSRAIMAASSSVGFCYSDVSSATNPHLSHQIQPTAAGFDQSNPAEIFNLTTGMEMIGFSKNQSPDSNSVMWKSFLGKNHPSSAAAAGPSKTINNESTSDFYQPHHHDHNQDQFDSTDGDLMDQSAAVAWQDHNSTNRSLLVDDSSLRCVFPCEGNERPSQGLSLSLSSTNPSGIGLQSFELRQTTPTHQQDDHVDHMRFLSSRNSFFTKSPQNLQHQEQQQMMMTSDHEFLGKASLQGQQLQNSMMNFQLRNSKYLAPAQELLNEFCSLGTKQNDPPKHKLNKNKQLLESDVDNGNGSTSSSSRNKLQHQNSSSSLHSLDIIELQKRKAKLLSMLEEVDRRYRHYCDQMKAVVSVFEAAAGNGAATVYSALASKAMSRHFRCLRDGIVSQIQATKKAMGEKDPVAPGASRGETPRLRVLDQTLRQQRAFQQMTMMESHPWRPQRGLPERSVSVLRAWLFEHFLHPYPSDVDKHILARQTGLSRSQVSNWFINARVRLWKPMVEEMYIEETKEQDNLNNNNNNMGASSDGITTTDADDSSGRPNHHILHDQDHKPTPDQLVRIDSECLSSIISNPDKDSSSKMITTNNKASASASAMQMQHNYGSYGAMELDFANYGHNTVSFGQDNNTFNGGVSLTLGLQQHGNNSGVSLAFSPASQGSLFYPRDHHQNHHHHQNQNQQQDQMEDCQPVVQYTMLDGEGQNLPYRNLMGAQLLHDLAG